MRHSTAAGVGVTALLVGALACSGCATRFAEAPPPVAPLPESPELPEAFELEPGRYNEAFAMAKDVLRRNRFTLDQVNARAGILTTRPARSSGYATPWIDHTGSHKDALEATLNYQRRSVAIGFTPRDGSQVDDLREYEGPLAVRVGVLVERVLVPGKKHTPVSVRMSSVTVNPEWVARNMQPAHAVPAGRDELLADELRLELIAQLRSKGHKKP